MVCYHPIMAYRHKFRKTENGKALIDFKGGSVLEWDELRLPCGRCIGCRLERSRQWAMRCVHEAQYHDHNSFITLTFDDEHLDPSGSLQPRDFVLFMKRLRKDLSKNGIKIRFMHCGEYGDQFERPHHHAIIFGYDFPDKYFWKLSDGFPLYRSPRLEQLWPFGYSWIGSVTFESCAYVARYVTKKVNGDEAEDHYHGRHPEYITMSRRPGIGYQWLMDHPEIYNYDDVVIRDNIHCKPAKYYDRIFEQIAPDFMKSIKAARELYAKEHDDIYRIPGRLADKEQYKLLQASRLVRNYEKKGV